MRRRLDEHVAASQARLAFSKLLTNSGVHHRGAPSSPK